MCLASLRQARYEARWSRRAPEATEFQWYCSASAYLSLPASRAGRTQNLTSHKAGTLNRRFGGAANTCRHGPHGAGTDSARAGGAACLARGCTNLSPPGAALGCAQAGSHTSKAGTRTWTESESSESDMMRAAGVNEPAAGLTWMWAGARLATAAGAGCLRWLVSTTPASASSRR